jgi:hypothetical protein
MIVIIDMRGHKEIITKTMIHRSKSCKHGKAHES